MAEETKKKREVQQHPLPKGYKSPFRNVISQWLTFGGTLPEGEILHKYEMQLGVPEVEDVDSLYGFKLGEIVLKGVQKLGTEVDNAFKKTLFAGIDKPTDAGNVDAKNHLTAQRQLDKYIYTPRVGKGKTTAVSNVVASLVAAGVLPESALAEITTNDELQVAIRNATNK